MANYLEAVDGKYFTDLANDVDFQKDMVKFFTGSRYGMSIDEIKEYTPTELAEKFVEHMRWQSTNEVTALRDYSYVQDKENISPEELQAFGKLMLAYDRSEGGGTGALSGAFDYVSAFATSPSTLATVGTAGWGFGSKLAAKAAGKATQIALRETVAELVKKGVATGAIQDQLVGTVAKGAIKGGAASFAAEGALGAGQSFLQGETRETAAGVTYSAGDMLRDGLIAGTIGGTLGSATRALDTKSRRAVVDSLITRDVVSTARKTAASAAAKETLAASDPNKVSAAADRAVTIAATLKARLDRVKLDPLDPKMVEEGNLLKTDVLSGKGDLAITGNLSVETLRGITAATVNISDKLNIQPNERISSAVARALERGDVDAQFLEDLREKYDLSKQQFSLIYLADLSQAGKTLAEASYISKKAGKKAAVKAAEAEVASVTSDLETLSSRGLNTIADQDALKIAADVYKGKDTIVSKAYGKLKDLDAMRIAFMTSQLGTTAANTVTSTGNLLIDMSDQFWKNFAGVVVGREIEGKVQRKWVGGMLSTVKGLSWDKSQAKLLKEIFMEEQPEEYARLFFEATRAEVAAESSTLMAKAGRGVNVINSAVDSVFKEAVLYSSVDRQLREMGRADIGTNLGEFLSKNLPLDSLPEEVMVKAVDDARRFTFQRSYRGDRSAFGQTAQAVITANEKIPFLISGAVGIPFPRYIANHLEHINDYTPIGIVTGGLNKLDSTLFGDTNKTGVDRFARQMTGASLILLGGYTAAQKNGEIDYTAIETETGVLDISRVAGPWLMNFYVGDLLYRWQNDLPTNDVLSTMAEISGGVTELGFNTDFINQVTESANQGEVSAGLARSLGDILATFSYPITFSRDFLAQVNPEMISTPYTKDVFGGSTTEPSMYGETNYFSEMVRRATRFLPEVDFVQITQSFNGKTAIPYYSPFSDRPVGSFDPILKQFGFSPSERPNDLQREMARLDLKEFEIYTNKRVPNPAVDVVVRELLGKSMPERFAVWKSQVTHSDKFAGQTYDEIEDMSARKSLLLDFIEKEISNAVDVTEQGYQDFLVNNKKAAAGYVRNMYVLQEKKLIEKSKDKETYDTAVKMFTNGNFATAADYLGDSDSIEEEIDRRQFIMTWAEEMSTGFTPMPTEEFK